MAKKSVSARNKKRIKLSSLKFAKRQGLKRVIKKGTDDERFDAIEKLQKTKRNESVHRVRNRCNNCGRSHGVYRKFGICRICLRLAVMRHGNVPGVRKSSW